MDLGVRVLRILSQCDQLMLYNPGQISLRSSVKAASEVSTGLSKMTDTEYTQYAGIYYFSLIPTQPCLITVPISMHGVTEAQIW